MSPLSRLYRRSAERRGSSLAYAAIFAVLGAAFGALIAFMVIVAPIAWIGGTILQMPVVGTLIDVACDIYDVPVIGDVAGWATGWFGGESACEAIEKIRAVDSEAEAAGFTAALRAQLDCTNWPIEDRAQARREGTCKDGLLAQATQSVIPSDKAGWLIGIYIRAADKYDVPWRLLAAVHGARSNFGERNCMPGGGFYAFTKKEWDAYGVDAGSVPPSEVGGVITPGSTANEAGGTLPRGCWTFEYEAGKKRDDGSAWVSYDPDGAIDPRDPVDAIFTQARLLSENGAKGRVDWDDYSGLEAGGCAVDVKLDGKVIAYIPPPEAEEDQVAEGATGATPDAVDVPAGSTPLMGGSKLTGAQLAKWFKSKGKNPRISTTIDNLANLFVEEGGFQGIRGDIAFAQSVLETGWFEYAGSSVKASDNNFSGLGATDVNPVPNVFPSPRIGVRAQIQHLWVYADKGAAPNRTAKPLADKRFQVAIDSGKRGIAPTWEKMGGGNWASGASYTEEVLGLYREALKFNGLNENDLSPGNISTGGAGSGSGGVVWVQAGHAAPREPGYEPQTGASGVAGSEIEFNTRVRDALVAKLKAAGITARPLAGRVDPMNAEGDVFISIHHDSRRGEGGIGHVGHARTTGGGENYYPASGQGEARATPYPDSTPHRTPASTVTPAVHASSTKLADRLSAEFKKVYTSANGAKGPWGGVKSGNRRVDNYYGYYRTKAKARVILETGAADETFLLKTDLIAQTAAKAIQDHLGVEGTVGDAEDAEAADGEDKGIAGTPPKAGIPPLLSAWPVSDVPRVYFPVKTDREVRLVNNFSVTDDLGKGGHPGVDVITPRGAVVRSVTPGAVVAVGPSADGGQEVRVRTPDRDVFIYGHLAAVKVKEGDRVRERQDLGVVSAEKAKVGSKKGPHLHFGILPRGDDVRYANPIKALATWLGKRIGEEKAPPRGQTAKADGLSAPSSTEGASPSTGTVVEEKMTQWFNTSSPTARRSPLKPFVPDMVRIAQAKGLDPRIIPAIALAETTLGTAGNDVGDKYNAWGMGPHMDLGDSWKDGITRFVHNLVDGSYYLRAGKYTIDSFEGTYCASACGDWMGIVKGAFRQMGGDANKAIFSQEAIEKYGGKGGGRKWGEAGSGEPAGPIQYAGKRQTDPVSRAVAFRAGEKKPHSPCYVAVVHDWYQGMMERPQGISGDDPSLEGTVLAQKIIEAAVSMSPAGRAKVGKPALRYSWGGGSPSGPTTGFCCSPGGNDGSNIGFDCSGFVNYAYAQAGVPTSSSQGHGLTTWGLWGLPSGGDEYNTSAAPTKGRDWIRGTDGRQMQPGDIILWSNLGHTGLYMGDGKAIHTGDPVGSIAELDARGNRKGRSDFVGWVRSTRVSASGSTEETPEDGWLVGFKGVPKSLKMTKVKIPFGKKRQTQMIAYSKRHYGPGEARIELTPASIIQHMAGVPERAPTIAQYRDNKPYQGERPGDCAHFVIDTDGAISQLVPLTMRCRLSTGLDYRAISIAHVGTGDRAVLANKAQARSSMVLTRYLQKLYSIKTDDVLGAQESVAPDLKSRGFMEKSPDAASTAVLGFGPRTMERYRKQMRRIPLGGQAPPKPQERPDATSGPDGDEGDDPGSGGSGSAPQEVQSLAQRLIDSLPGKASLSVVCGEVSLEVRGDQRLRSASTLKVAVALAAIKRRKMSPSAISDDASMRAMIIESDNSAANTLIERAGGFSGVSTLFTALNMQDTALDAAFGSAMNTMQKSTTANDLRLMAQALQGLVESGSGPLARYGLSEAQGRALLELMGRARHPGLTSAGIDGADIYHKAGWLPGVENDVAIVRVPGGATCALGIMTDGAGTARARKVAADIMKRVVKPLAVPPAPEAESGGSSGGSTGGTGGTVDGNDAGPGAVGIRPLTSAQREAMISGNVWKRGCPVGLDELRSVTVNYVGFDGKVRAGRLVVHKDVAEDAAAIFKDLLKIQFPIRRIEPIEKYGGSDGESIDNDNTSAFNCRRVSTGTGEWSNHAYGKAIDINPIENPYVNANGTLAKDRPASRPYVSRPKRPGVLLPGSPAVRAFTSRGWRWLVAEGGDKDYQHFDKN